MTNLEIYKNNFIQKGTVLIPLEENLISISETKQLENICNNVPKEHIEIGDAGESNYLEVGRFMTDKDIPKIVNKEFAVPLIEIISKNKIKKMISDILDIDENEIFYRRIQFNEIKQNCFVGYHLDTDSNPDYLIACVIQLGKDFEGGLYRVYQKDKSYIDYQPSYGSLIISNCKYPHEVTKVTKGNRGSLVFFISKNKGKNKKII